MLKMERKHNALIAHLDGEIDQHHAMFLRAALDRVLEESGISTLIFNLSQVEFMDSSGIGLIIGRYKRMKTRGGQVYISGGNHQIDRILHLSGIDTLIRRIDTPSERSMHQ